MKLRKSFKVVDGDIKAALDSAMTFAVSGLLEGEIEIMVIGEAPGVERQRSVTAKVARRAARSTKGKTEELVGA